MEGSGNHKEIRALIRLLDETDPGVIRVVEERLLQMGCEALPHLEEEAQSVLNQAVQEKISSILGRIRSGHIKNDLKKWNEEGGTDLLKAYAIISRINEPGLDEMDLIVKVEQIRMDTWLELNDDLTALENIKVLNHIFFQHHKFTGNKYNPRIPGEQFLPYLLSAKKGNSLTLGILYLIIAQKLDIPLAGVNLPDHFILAYLSGNEIQSPTPDDVLFYINPFKGSVFTRREIEMFLRQLKIKADIRYFSPCSNKQVIIRFLKTLIIYYNEDKDFGKVAELEQLLGIIQSEK